MNLYDAGVFWGPQNDAIFEGWEEIPDFTTLCVKSDALTHHVFLSSSRSLRCVYFKICSLPSARELKSTQVTWMALKSHGWQFVILFCTWRMGSQWMVQWLIGPW